MRNLHRHNNNRSLGRTVLLAVSVTAVLVMGINMLTGGIVRTAVHEGASSVWGATANAQNAITSSGLFTSHRSLAEENLALRAQISSLNALALSNEVLVEENNSLRALTSVTERYETTLSAEVLSHEQSSPYGTIVIGAGAAQGIVAGSLVLAEGGVLIGTIEHVGVHTSQVRTALAPGREVSGRIGQDTAVVVAGRGGGNGLIYVPRNVAVEEGDLVYYAAGSSILGEVGAIEASAADAEKKLYVRTPLNLYGVRFVTVFSGL